MGFLSTDLESSCSKESISCIWGHLGAFEGSWDTPFFRVYTPSFHPFFPSSNPNPTPYIDMSVMNCLFYCVLCVLLDKTR